jgi:hypothetical protein
MSLRINSEVPDFSAETTQGNVNFHKWMGDPVLPSKGFHAGLHNRARLYGGANARV